MGQFVLTIGLTQKHIFIIVRQYQIQHSSSTNSLYHPLHGQMLQIPFFIIKLIFIKKKIQLSL